MKDQIEIPQVPPVGHLKKLRTRLLPLADEIIAAAKAAELELWVHPDTPGIKRVPTGSDKAIARRRRELDKRLGALGVPQRSIGRSDFPKGTSDVAAASGEFFVALESAFSAIVGVSDAERAAIESRRSG